MEEFNTIGDVIDAINNIDGKIKGECLDRHYKAIDKFVDKFMNHITDLFKHNYKIVKEKRYAHYNFASINDKIEYDDNLIYKFNLEKDYNKIIFKIDRDLYNTDWYYELVNKCGLLTEPNLPLIIQDMLNKRLREFHVNKHELLNVSRIDFHHVYTNKTFIGMSFDVTITKCITDVE